MRICVRLLALLCLSTAWATRPSKIGLGAKFAAKRVPVEGLEERREAAVIQDDPILVSGATGWNGRPRSSQHEVWGSFQQIRAEWLKPVGRSTISLRTFAWSFALAVLLSLLYFAAWRRLAQELGISEIEVDGSPCWLYFASITGQLVYISLGVVAFLASGLSLLPELRRTWDLGHAPGQDIEVVWFFLFIGNVCKDFPAGMGPLMFLHHILCLVAAVTFLFQGPPGYFIIGACTLEVGSVFFNLAALYPTSRAIAALDVAVMTVSNGISCWGAYFLFRLADVAPAVRYFFSVVLLILVFERQRALLHRRRVEEGDPCLALKACATAS